MKDLELSNKELRVAFNTILGLMTGLIFEPDESKNSSYERAVNVYNQLVDIHYPQIASVNIDKNFLKDWARLFYGVNDSCIGMTHSYWTEGGKSLVGNNTQTTYQAYKTKGLKNNTTLPDDHLIVEMSFLSSLIEQDRNSEAQTFLQNEILVWFPSLVAKVKKQSTNKDIHNFFNNLDLLFQLLLTHRAFK